MQDSGTEPALLQQDKVNYYEPAYKGGCFGLSRYVNNFCRQSALVKTNVLVAFGMAVIELIELAATL